MSRYVILCPLPHEEENGCIVVRVLDNLHEAQDILIALANAGAEGVRVYDQERQTYWRGLSRQTLTGWCEVMHTSDPSIWSDTEYLQEWGAA